MTRPSIRNCDKRGLAKLAEALFSGDQSVMRAKLVFAAGVANNTKLLKELGSQESSSWMEGRRAADPSYINPYWPDHDA